MVGLLCKSLSDKRLRKLRCGCGAMPRVAGSAAPMAHTATKRPIFLPKSAADQSRECRGTRRTLDPPEPGHGMLGATSGPRT